jgi:hypothetical protein
MEPYLWKYTNSLTVHEYITPYSVEREPNHVIVEMGREVPFYGALTWCPNCERSTEINTTRETSYLTDGDDPCLNRFYQDEIFTCKTCGWWSSSSSESTGSDSVDSWIEWKTIKYSILKAFSASDKDLPIDTLQSALVNRPGLLYFIHDKKFEELVAAIMEDFYPGCEVTICGRSGDRGIDLIVINSNTPIAIQVRRRRSSGKVETVYPIREFLGASLLQDYREIIYVTSGKFSRGAVTTAKEAVARQLVDRFELVDANRLRSMLNLAITNKRMD